MEPEPLAEPSAPSRQVTDRMQDQTELYTIPDRSESFQEHRARVEKQETLPFQKSYGPERETQKERTTPYSHRPLGEDEKEESLVQIDVSLMEQTGGLPPGWACENGYLVLGPTHDEWQLSGNHLTIYHYLGRTQEFTPTEENCPIPLRYLAKQRVTKTSLGQLHRDRWTRRTPCKNLRGDVWTGYTRFKLQNGWKSKGKADYLEKSTGFETVFLQEDKTKTTVNERTLNVEDRLKFLEAKQKELKSFFDNEVWTFDNEHEATPGRILRAKFILNWKKGDAGALRAKARRICQGFKDPDALTGTLATSSPTLTRLSRSFLLTLTGMLGYTPFTADITTAFLQGKKYDPESARILWVKIPRDAETLLGLPPGHGTVMRLTKPMYGLVDAPKAWYDEACHRILQKGAGCIIQHPLDNCLFLAFDQPIPAELPEGATPPRLISAFGIHVDDLFGCCNEEDPETKLLQDIKSIFSFGNGIPGLRRTNSPTAVPKSPRWMTGRPGRFTTPSTSTSRSPLRWHRKGRAKTSRSQRRRERHSEPFWARCNGLRPKRHPTCRLLPASWLEKSLKPRPRPWKRQTRPYAMLRPTQTWDWSIATSAARTR